MCFPSADKRLEKCRPETHLAAGLRGPVPRLSENRVLCISRMWSSGSLDQSGRDRLSFLAASNYAARQILYALHQRSIALPCRFQTTVIRIWDLTITRAPFGINTEQTDLVPCFRIQSQ